jgi:hypothetical protein
MPGVVSVRERERRGKIDVSLSGNANDPRVPKRAARGEFSKQFSCRSRSRTITETVIVVLQRRRESGRDVALDNE